jgi:hypothetical protein
VHFPGGSTKQVPTRESAAFDYAEPIATGTGVYGPYGQRIRPVEAKALLIPVRSAPPRGVWVEGPRGEVFVLAPTAKGEKPDDYPGRAAAEMERRAPYLIESAFAREGMFR